MKKLTKPLVFLFLFVWLLPQTALATQLLLPVGELIGIALQDNSVTIAAFDPELGQNCEKAGLKAGDRILSIDNKKITCVQDVKAALQRSGGTVEVTVLRGKKEKNFRLTPEITTDGPKLGILLKEGMTGVGTVTFYDPDSGRYGALGHGVNTPAGSLLAMRTGNAYEACLVTVKKGKAGTPGQLMGTLKSDSCIGTVEKNTCQGIFGKADTPWQGQVLPVCPASDIKTGDATIRSTVAGNGVQEYSVEIIKIYPSDDTRNLLLKVTDPELLSATGGIVQGMSGSPLIQDGKLIGAVTHVLVNDPTTGYGIFIENMLDAAS